MRSEQCAVRPYHGRLTTLLTTDYSPLTTHHSPLTTHYALHTTEYVPTCYSPGGRRHQHTTDYTLQADGVIMAVQHVSLPMAAVQFHPESILTRTDLGLQMLRNALSQLRY